MHVTEFLQHPEKHSPGPMVALVGSERYLKQSAIEKLTALAGAAGELEVIRMAGRDADLTTVRDELLRVSMWGERRLVLVDHADDFVSNYRAGLEKYLEQPAKHAVLALDVKSFPKTTRLAKSLEKVGLVLDCAPMAEGDLIRWLTAVAKHEDKKLGRNAAGLMIQLAGKEVGLLEQELQKLISYVGGRAEINDEDVRTLVGGWKAETTWVMLNALRDGHLDQAIHALHTLLVSGEAPQMILGGVNFVYRKLARATEMARSGTNLNTALKDAGVFPRDVSDASQYLRRLGRPRAEQIYNRLLEIDGNLKGQRRIPPRIELESLLVQLSGLV